MKNKVLNKFLEEFFAPIRINNPIDEKYKERIPNYVRAADAQSQITNASLYILDYVEKRLVFVSDKERIMCGYSKGEIEKMGISFLKNILYPDDLELFKNINEDIFCFYYNKIEPSESYNYWATYDLRIITKDDETDLFNFRFLPLDVDAMGNIILAMVQVDIPTNKKPGNLLIYSITERKFFEYKKENNTLAPVKLRLLNKREKQVIKLLSKGLIIKEIAEIMAAEKFTINYYCKSILQKMGVSNMKEAVSLYAQKGNIL